MKRKRLKRLQSSANTAKTTGKRKMLAYNYGGKKIPKKEQNRLAAIVRRIGKCWLLNNANMRRGKKRTFEVKIRERY